MDEQVEKLLAGVSNDTLEAVTREVLDDPSAKLIGTPDWQPVGGLHNDLRTVAVLKCSGRAISGGCEKAWSTVFKHIDLTMEMGRAAHMMDPLNEISFYRDGTFVDSNVPFRSARCYRVDELDPKRFSVWMEDLSTSIGPPWSAEQYERASGYLGQFQGEIVREQTRLPYAADRDIFKNRWTGFDLGGALKVLQEERSHPEIRKAFTGDRLDLVIELIQMFPVLLERVGQVQRVLSHGDCHARNLFLTDEELVAIDWSGLSYEPLGSDFGQMVGGGLIWGFDEQITVVEAVPKFFDAYVQGLSASGWDGDERTLRLGMSGQFMGYVIVVSILPALVMADPSFTARVTARLGLPADEISSATARFLEFAEPFMRDAIEMAKGE